MIRRISAVILVVPLLLSGCLITESPEELERLTKEDPSFEKMILARNQTHAQIAAIKDDLLGRKRTMEAQTARLHAEYDAHAKAQNQKIAQLRSLIDGHRQALKTQIETARAAMESKQIEVEGYRKTLGDVRQMLRESKGIVLSEKERRKWDERILMLTEKIRPLEDEIRELRLEIRLKNQKIRYLH